LQLTQRAGDHHPHGPVAFVEFLGDFFGGQSDQVTEPEGLAFMLKQSLQRREHPSLALIAESHAGKDFRIMVCHGGDSNV